MEESRREKNEFDLLFFLYLIYVFDTQQKNRFVFLAIMTLGSLMYRLATLLSSRVRVYGLIGASSFTTSAQMNKVLKKLGRSEWFLLRFLKLNLDEETFKILIKLIYEEL